MAAEDMDELEDMKRRVQQMEDEAAKIEALSNQAAQGQPPAQAVDTDSRSVYVGNVDYSVTPEELQSFFSSCGSVSRITILCDKFTGHPKGFAYVEFADMEGVTNAMMLNESEFKGRQLKVMYTECTTEY
jgi:polyadenylate-binding protein 2